MSTRKSLTVKIIKCQNRLSKEAVGYVSSGTFILGWTRLSENWPCFKLGERRIGDKMTSRGHIQAVLITVVISLSRKGNCNQAKHLFCPFYSICNWFWASHIFQVIEEVIIDCRTKIIFSLLEPSIFCGKQMATTCTNVWIPWKWICRPFCYCQAPAS